MKVLLLTGLRALFFAYYWADNLDPASLQGARVLLAGASAGVGEERAYHYAHLGSHLVLTAHTEAFLQKETPISSVVGNCRKLGAPKVFFIAADMASLEVPERVVQFALDKLGGLDYLVLNHLGAAPPGRVPTSISSPYSAAKFALDSFFGSLQRELDVQDVNVAITVCVLGLQDRASAKEGVRGWFIRQELNVTDTAAA